MANALIAEQKLPECFKQVMIIFSAIVPHPPIIIPGIGREEDLKLVRKTISAMKKLRRDLTTARPDTVLVISPHAPLKPYSFGINSAAELRGDLLAFGLSKSFVFPNDRELAEKIHRFAAADRIASHFYEGPLDHGALVPLYYLTKDIKPKLVHLSFSMLDFLSHYHYGEAIGNACFDSFERIAIVASGDLSHRLILDAPAGYSPQGRKFDEKIKRLIAKKDIEGILNLDLKFVEEAGECGLRSFIILLGILKGEYSFDLLNYEGPFGVGYLTAQLYNE